MAIPGIVSQRKISRRRIIQGRDVIQLIITTVCEKYNVTEKQLRGVRQDRAISYPRQVAMYLLYRYTKWEEGLFKQYFNRNRATVILGYKTIRNLMDVYGHVRNEIADITLKVFC